MSTSRTSAFTTLVNSGFHTFKTGCDLFDFVYVCPMAKNSRITEITGYMKFCKTNVTTKKTIRVYFNNKTEASAEM